ncbi:MAG: glycosyltransferase [Lentisphaeria bacterium]|nr:glycosyltransferase [Lentisphaeria bacterium]
MRARIAVLLPVYNAEKFLRECLDSILHQTFPDFLLLACNDGSTDGSPDILKEYAAKDARIRILENPGNMGIVETRNHLLRELPDGTDYVAWIDSDDVMFPDRLQRQSSYLDTHPEIGGVGSALEIIDENSRVTGFRPYPVTPAEIRRQLPLQNILAQPALMLRSDVIRRTGYYSSSCPVCQDYEYWLRVLDFSDFANLSDPVIRYRISATQVKQTKLKLSLRLTLEIQRDYFRRNRLRMPLACLFRQAAGYLLLLLPSSWILRLFKILTYRAKRSAK